MSKQTLQSFGTFNSRFPKVQLSHSVNRMEMRSTAGGPKLGINLIDPSPKEKNKLPNVKKVSDNKKVFLEFPQGSKPKYKMA